MMMMKKIDKGVILKGSTKDCLYFLSDHFSKGKRPTLSYKMKSCSLRGGACKFKKHRLGFNPFTSEFRFPWELHICDYFNWILKLYQVSAMLEKFGYKVATSFSVSHCGVTLLKII